MKYRIISNQDSEYSVYKMIDKLPYFGHIKSLDFTLKQARTCIRMSKINKHIYPNCSNYRIVEYK